MSIAKSIWMRCGMKETGGFRRRLIDWLAPKNSRFRLGRQADPADLAVRVPTVTPSARIHSARPNPAGPQSSGRQGLRRPHRSLLNQSIDEAR
jgi:hypothetical protein